jgi:hypothetical protein
MRVRRLASGLLVTCILLAAGALVLLVLNGGSRHANSLGAPVLDAVFGVLFLTYPVVGAAIAARQPRNPIGWLFLLAGVGASLEDFLLGWAQYALVTDPGALPGGALAAAVADAIWLPCLAAASLMLFVLFPTGRPLTRRWGLLVWAIGIDVTAFALLTLVNPGPLYFYPAVANPLGAEALGDVAQALLDVASPVLFVSLVLGCAALAVRFRRAAGVERRQLKWLFYAAALWVACLPGLIALGESGDAQVGGVVIADLVFSLLLAMMPVAVGVAILRHRLYDIDLVIRRTLVYGALTATLAASYLASVLLVSLAVGESGFAVAVSTLGVAALFRRALTRIQAAVDRRFYRRRYDAARTLEAFGARLRDELDLEALTHDLSGVVRETVQPSHVSVWLR